jgi:hypothetical protein
VPRVTDLNGNGQIDLVVGSERGRLFFYPDVSLQSGAGWTESPRSIYSSLSGTGDSSRLGRFVCPTPAHLNGDSLPDLLVGTLRGGVMTLHNLGATLNVTPIQTEEIDLRLVPNPAVSGSTTLLWEPSRVAAGWHQLRVVDARGRVVLTSTLIGAEGQYPIRCEGTGLYWVEVQWSDGRMSRKRLLVR